MGFARRGGSDRAGANAPSAKSNGTSPVNDEGDDNSGNKLPNDSLSE